MVHCAVVNRSIGTEDGMRAFPPPLSPLWLDLKGGGLVELGDYVVCTCSYGVGIGSSSEGLCGPCG